MYSDYQMLKSNPELRFMARQQLKGNWTMPLVVCLLYSAIVGGASAFLGTVIPAAGSLISAVIMGPMALGITMYFIRFKSGENPPLEMMFDGFKFFTQSFVLQLLISLFIFLWSLLLIVPGIIAALNYSLAFYILNDNPSMQPMDVLKQSKEMIKGKKGKLFMLYLSFFGWALLCILTLGIGFLWLNPYVSLTMAHFYDDLKNSNTYGQTPPGVIPVL